MGFLDRILGRELPEPERRPATSEPTAQRSDDEIAVERYEYLLRTAPPETIEQVHTEAFGKLTPEQRDLLFARLSENPDPSERPADAAPATLAKAATRTELRQPGTLTRAFGGGSGGMGFGGMVGSSLLGTVAGYVIGSALVSAFLPTDAGGDTAESGESGDGGGDAGGGDAGGDTAGGGDFGGDGGGGFGDFGGDFGF